LNRLSTTLLLVAAVAAFAGQANSADLPAATAPPTQLPAAASHTWTGCYLGAGGGYGAWTQDFTATVGGVPLTNQPTPTTNGGRGAFGTVQGGCDYQFAGN
jgi:outer membrane immunogenic protein